MKTIDELREQLHQACARAQSAYNNGVGQLEQKSYDDEVDRARLELNTAIDKVVEQVILERGPEWAKRCVRKAWQQ